uniref:Uncharacterized protein n=1 Tax=Rhizophora mucronata TaxID=61149 RepID=A0A2P2MPY0_RHIMU
MTRSAGQWRLIGSSRSFCQKSEPRGKDFSPTNDPIRYSAVSCGRESVCRGIEGTVPIRNSVDIGRPSYVNSAQRRSPAITTCIYIERTKE